MKVLSVLFLLAGLFCRAGSTALYPQSTQHPPGLLHDFQKDNVSVSWALGHPKEWSDKAALKYEFSDGGPYRYTSGAIYAAALSSDEKYLVTVNVSRHVTVVDFATGIQVSDYTLSSTYAGDGIALRVLAGPSGYDILVSMNYQEVQRLPLSLQGVQTGNITIYPGGLLYEKCSPSVSHNERRFITVVPTAGQYTIYDLGDPNVHLVLKNQINDMYDVAFTPDDKYVVTRSFSWNGMPGSTKMFDTTTGTLVRDFNDTNSEALSISPDGTLLATTNSWDAVQIWSLKNTTSPPTTLTLPTKPNGGVARLAWNPDGTYLAASGFANLFVWKLYPSPEIVQWYQLDGNGHDVSGLLWLSGHSRLAYRSFGGLEIYDFETNSKYRWGFSPNSHWADGLYLLGSTVLAKSEKWIGGLDGDANVRFWEVPAKQD